MSKLVKNEKNSAFYCFYHELACKGEKPLNSSLITFEHIGSISESIIRELFVVIVYMTRTKDFCQSNRIYNDLIKTAKRKIQASNPLIFIMC